MWIEGVGFQNEHCQEGPPIPVCMVTVSFLHKVMAGLSLRWGVNIAEGEVATLSLVEGCGMTKDIEEEV